jgi:putative hemin transport protein
MSTHETTETRPTPFFQTGKRSRDLAQELGISEAELLARHDGPEVTRLRAEPAALVESWPALGEVMALTRNEVAVHEKVGVFDKISIGGMMGLVLNHTIDLRLFLKHWQYVFAVELPDEKGPRRSFQVFDGSGEAVIKIHLRPASDTAAFAAIRDRFADPDAPPLAVVPPVAAVVAETVDGEGFRRDFAAMSDVHEFFPLLRRHGLTRRAALDVMEKDSTRPLGSRAATRLLEAASAAALPIMCFVGNRGCIQIHTGPVANIKPMGPWINVLDPGFDLHLREDLVAEAHVVRKPTSHGEITSVELYDRAGELVTQFFGVRDPKAPEDERWRALVQSL